MEEILASIRRIISDDDPGRHADAQGEAGGPAADEAGAHPAPWPAGAPRTAAWPPSRRAEAASGPSSDPAPREDEIDSMLAQLQATSRQSPGAADDPPARERAVEATTTVRPFDEHSDMDSEKRTSQLGAARAPEERRPAAAPEPGDRGLMSAATTAAVGSAFHSLAQTVQMRNERTLEDVVSEILRPMLKTWLDEHLPEIVERLVRADIERVSRGRD